MSLLPLSHSHKYHSMKFMPQSVHIPLTMWHDVGAGGATVGLRTRAHIVAEDARHTLAAIAALERRVEAVEGALAPAAAVAGRALALVALLRARLVHAAAAQAGLPRSADVLQLAVLACLVE